MKKTILVSAIIFAVVFMLWPSTKYDNGGCDKSTLTKELCYSREIFDKPGGGIVYILKVIGNGSLASPIGGTYSPYVLEETAYNEFSPVRALLGALFSALVTGVGVYVLGHRKHAKAK